MPIAVDPAKVVRYVLRAERELPPEQQTVFLLKALTARETADVEDALFFQTAIGTMVRNGSQRLRILGLGVVGWENFPDSQGRPVPFNTQDKAANWDRIAPEYQTELANAIMEANRLNAADRKN